MKLSIVACASVIVHRLQDRTELNGRIGEARQYDDSACRWEVKLQGIGFKKIKAENLKVTNGCARHRRKLCKFGQRCFRPQCWFIHADECARADAMMNLWKQHKDTCNHDPIVDGNCLYDSGAFGEGEAVDGDDAALRPSEPKMRMATSDVIRKIETIEHGLKQAVAEMNDRIATSEQSFNRFVNDQLADIDRASGLQVATQEQLASVQDQLCMVETRALYAAEAQTVRQLEETKDTMQAPMNQLRSTMEARLGDELRDLILGTLRAAITPLAETMTKKLLEIEGRLSVVAPLLDEEDVT